MNFNWEVYRALNPDLTKRKLFFKEQFEHHFYTIGLKEKRKYSIHQLYPDFDAAVYKHNYLDLSRLSKTELEVHWLVYGKKEGRTYYEKPSVQVKLTLEPVYIYPDNNTPVEVVVEQTEVDKNEKQLPENDVIIDSGYVNKKNFQLGMGFIEKVNYVYELPHVFIPLLDKINESNVDKKPILLTVAESLYPSNGGGENWLLDINQMFKNDFFIVGICFKDVFNRINFQNVEMIVHNDMYIIQMPIVVRDLIELIKKLQPKTILHQGFYRLLICKIARILGINFVTGFCFWNDLIKMNKNYFNINMINRKYEIDDNLDKILNNSNSYLASQFMKKVLIKNNKTIDKQIINNIPIIETISSTNHYFGELNKDRQYVCIMNTHYLKGGQELLYLLQNLNINIPILAINTEKSSEKLDEQIRQAFANRNRRNNINILFDKKQDNVKDIYMNCKVLLVPSIVDETFCRVAYEGMALGLNIVSYRTGNLEYLLKSYEHNTFIECPVKTNNNDVSNVNIDKTTLNQWLNVVKTIYSQPSTGKPINVNKVENEIKSKIDYYIKNEVKPFVRDTIGFYCPFVDQGLGIQCREYVSFLNKHGYKTAIFSFKPYKAVQVNPAEWGFENVYYSNNDREQVIIEELLDFFFNYNIKVIMIPEICYKPIYSKIDYIKALGVKVICIINIEILRFNELQYYHYFDMILANNESSYTLMKKLMPSYNNIRLLEFNNEFMPKNDNLRNVNLLDKTEKIKLATFGGFNSFIRKNIDKTYEVFKKLETLNNMNYELNIYIQGTDEACNNPIQLENTKNIKIHYTNLSYFGIITLIQSNDIIIHLGDHEGLGLGFFEALNNNKLLITLDTYPNKELIKDNNGFLIKTTFEPLSDNDCGIVNKAIVDVKDYYLLMTRILHDNFRENLNSMIISNKIVQNNYENNFIEIVKELGL